MTIHLEECSAKLKKHLFLRTEPLGIGMLKVGEEKPDGFLQPCKDLGYHLSTCQGFALSRRSRMSLCMTMDDMWCFEPVVGYGLAEPPEDFLEGHNRYPSTASSLEAGRQWASSMPRFRTGQYQGVLSAPLSSFPKDRTPDVVIIYCDPSQLTHIMRAVNWIDGKDIYSRISAHAACVYAVIPTMLENSFQVVVPCGGDRRRAAAQDNEIIFSLPIEKLEKLVEALDAIGEADGGLPVQFTLKEEYPLEPHYRKMGLEIGMKLDRE